MYDINPNSFVKAKQLGVRIVSSKQLKKKIDVYDWNRNYICSIGGGKDYYFYVDEYGKPYADYKRIQYWFRHRKDINKIGSNAYYTALLLW